MVTQAREQGVDLVGPGGLLTSLTKWVLEAQMTDRHGYDTHDRIGRNHGNLRRGGAVEAGAIEIGPVHEVINQPAHPYTMGLMAAIPDMTVDRERLHQIDGSMPRLCILRMGGMPWRMFISIGTASETCAPASLTLCQAVSDMPVI